MARLRERSTSDLLVLMLGGTICTVIVVAMVTVTLLALFQPQQDTTAAAAGIADVITTLIGVLAGFLAGRTETARTSSQSGRATQDEADEPARSAE